MLIEKIEEFPMREFDTSKIQQIVPSVTLHENRKNMVEAVSVTDAAQVTIVIQAYNRVKKTKKCIETILKYTTGIDFELFLIDNGSDDETLQYFQQLDYQKKKIIHINKNVGSMLPSFLFSPSDFCRYIAWLPNDVEVTKNWLSNLITVLESDEKIGMVCPVSSNISNLQQVDLQFHSEKEMQERAARFNCSNPAKWQERLRLMTVVTVYRKECVLAAGLPIADIGYLHDFADDDISFRVRRAGYKIVLAGDTWVHHNHNIWQAEDKDPIEFQESLKIGRANFEDKFQGIDAWDDVNNFWIDVAPKLPVPTIHEKKYILGVDVKCGTPILDIKNFLRTHGIFDVELSAFTQMAKYVTDLHTICEGIVTCDREEFFANQFPMEYYDYVVMDKPLNRYHEPQQMLDDMMKLLKPSGILLFPLLNTFGVYEYLHCQGNYNLYNAEFSYNIPVEAVHATLSQRGNVLFTASRSLPLSQKDIDMIDSRLPKELSKKDRSEVLSRLMVDRYILAVQKISRN